jgi:hypothetical protein
MTQKHYDRRHKKKNLNVILKMTSKDVNVVSEKIKK